MESCSIVEYYPIAHDALLYSILDGSDKVYNSGATVVNEINVFIAEVVGIDTSTITLVYPFL